MTNGHLYIFCYLKILEKHISLYAISAIFYISSLAIV